LKILVEPSPENNTATILKELQFGGISIRTKQCGPAIYINGDANHFIDSNKP